MPSLKAGESFATGMVRPRTTALFFDKLWVHPALWDFYLIGTMKQYAVPTELCISNPLGTRDYYLAYGYNMGFFAWDKKDANWENFGVPDFVDEIYPKPVPFETTDFPPYFVASVSDFHYSNSFQKDSIKEFNFREDHYNQPPGYKDTFGGERSTKYRNRAIHDLVRTYAKEGIKLTPIYLHPTEYEEVISQDQPGIEVCLDFIPVILDSELTWEQVLEFRKDRGAREKLDRMRRWFTTDLLGKNASEIESILGKKLDDYQWALKKHGIQTVVGGVTSVLSFAAGPTALQFLTESPLAAIAGGLALGGGVLAWVTNKLIERTEIQRDEVAYIYEVKILKN